MNKSNRLLFAAGICLGQILYAQSDNAPDHSNAGGNKSDTSIKWTDNSDSDWDLLSGEFKQKNQNSMARSRGANRANKNRQAETDEYQGMADLAREFRSKYPDHPQASEARKLESQALLRAVLSGNEELTDRTESLAAEVIDDKSLAEEERFQVASQIEILRGQKFPRDTAKLREARIASANRLITKFPKHAGGYLALLSVAENELDVQEASKITEGLLKKDVPESIRKAAQRVHDRAQVVGSPLLKLVTKHLETDGGLEKWAGEIVIIYTWGEWSLSSLNEARELTILAPTKVGYFGLYLGDDIGKAQKFAQNHRLPGEQLVASKKQRAALAEALGVGSSFPIYIADPEGNIALVERTTVGLPDKVRGLQKNERK